MTKKKKSRQELGKSSRTKGQRYENRWCHMIREVGIDPKANRNLCESRTPDIDIETSLPFAFQVRSGIGVSIWKAIADAEEGQRRRGKQGWPAGVIFETDRKTDCFVVMRFQDFIELVGKIAPGHLPSFLFHIHDKAHIAVRNLFLKDEKKRKADMYFYLIEFKNRPSLIAVEGYSFLELVRLWLRKKKVIRRPI